MTPAASILIAAAPLTGAAGVRSFRVVGAPDGFPDLFKVAGVYLLRGPLQVHYLVRLPAIELAVLRRSVNDAAAMIVIENTHVGDAHCLLQAFVAHARRFLRHLVLGDIADDEQPTRSAGDVDGHGVHQGQVLDRPRQPRRQQEYHDGQARHQQNRELGHGIAQLRQSPLDVPGGIGDADLSPWGISDSAQFKLSPAQNNLPLLAQNRGGNYSIGIGGFRRTYALQLKVCRFLPINAIACRRQADRKVGSIVLEGDRRCVF